MRSALLGGGLAVLAVVVALSLLVAGNALFRGEPSVMSTLLPAPGVAPDKGKLVYVCSEPVEGPDSTLLPQICVADYEAGRRFQITDNLAFHGISHLAWSPDGQQIVFSANVPMRPQKLYVIDADGSDLRQVTDGELPQIEPAWSPDGEWVVFTRGDALWLVRPDGSESRALLVEEQAHLGMAAWAPDSQRIAFLRIPVRPDSLLVRVWTVNQDGSNPRSIYAFERSEGEGIFLGWSPDGQQVGCFLLGRDGATTLLIDADGSGEAQAMEGVFSSWLPDYWPMWGEVR